MMGITFEWQGNPPPISVARYRQRARRRRPQIARAYLDGGADDLDTLTANEAGFLRWRLRQKILAAVSVPNLATVVAGARLSVPVAIAPTAIAGLFHRGGEAAAAIAAERAGSFSF
jgi:isopentenyl diphosphate isomerase/L-lactate dehydrogenase-like FMN-dependent dehydrogenase